MKGFNKKNTKKILSVITALGLCIAPLSANAASSCTAKQAIENMLKSREIPAISELINCSDLSSCDISGLTQNMRSIAEKLGDYINCGNTAGIGECIKQLINSGSGESTPTDDCDKGSCDAPYDDCTDENCGEAEIPDEKDEPQTPSAPEATPDQTPDNSQSEQGSASGGSTENSGENGTQTPSGDSSTENSVPEADNSEMPGGYAYEVISLVNAHRTAAGLEPLSYTNPALMAAAQKRAEEQQQVYSHTRPDGSSCFTVLDEYGISYRGAGENIAMGQRTPEEVVEDWMNSEGHRKNIMNPSFTQIGVGVHEAGGRYYWSQMFIA